VQSRVLGLANWPDHGSGGLQVALVDITAEQIIKDIIMRTALIIGATGQDGAYLARSLLGRGYLVHGSSRDAAIASRSGLQALGIEEKVALHTVLPTDFRSVIRAIETIMPDEIYNLSGQSSVALSFSEPAATLESNVLSTLNVLEAIRQTKADIRFYAAGSSECFGDTGSVAANEETAFRPKSPYGVAKAATCALVSCYRHGYGLYACCGLLFNHESPLRPDRFVTRKITSAAARIARTGRERLRLGNLAVRRDWGWAPDYVEAMWAMLQKDVAEDFVIATGISHSLEEFVAAAFNEMGLDWHDHVDIDPLLRRPNDIKCSLGNPQKAARVLGWRPELSFSEIVAQMVHAELEATR
jgi:GDPmannose 4,6-dehydratase